MTFKEARVEALKQLDKYNEKWKAYWLQEAKEYETNEEE